MPTFFTSDTHFGHRRILELASRPYADIVEHDRAMIEAWNARVRPDDEVWHLGDFAYKSPRHPREFFARLHGVKHLVIGNHDKSDTLDLPWASQQQVADIVVDKVRLVLCHYPFLEWNQMRRGTVHLFGHVHGRLAGMPGSLDVGVDNVGPAPVSLAEVLVRLGIER